MAEGGNGNPIDELSGGMKTMKIDNKYVQRVKDMDDEDKEKVFKRIFNTPLCGSTYIQTAYLVYELNGDGPVKIQNIAGDKHAEILLIEELEKSEAKEKDMNLRIFINNSPCSECSLNLLDFLNKKENGKWNMCMYVAHLFKYPNKKAPTKEQEVTLANLNKLIKHEHFQIEAFDKKVWKDLSQILETGEAYIKQYETKDSCQERSRSSQDKIVKEKLNNIH